MADNLPNDPKIHQEKGTKKLFFKNFMDARVNYVVLPISKLMMKEDQATMASMEGYLAVVLMHEILHATSQLPRESYLRQALGERNEFFMRRQITRAMRSLLISRCRSQLFGA